MDNLKHEEKLSSRNRLYVVVCLAIGLFGVALFRNQFPSLRGELSDVLFLSCLVVMAINVIGKKK